MTPYQQAIQFLYDLRLFGAKLGLENTFRLAELAGNPQDHLRFIHVAGTNGKGSTCAMLESIYRHAGLRVGLFTSPHLVRFNERIQVDRVPIPELEIVHLVQKAKGWMEKFSSDGHPTFFEVVTVMALRYFAEQHCDLVIWETGMGGRLDATNIVTPLASVITNIHLDHQQWLGSTIAEIAFEKAGIIKPGVPVITAAEPNAGLETITEVARQNNAPLTIVNRSDASRLSSDKVDLSLPGEHQRLNAALALATVRALDAAERVPTAIALHALKRVDWPGRLQFIKLPDGRQLLLDGAHNPAGILTLCHALDNNPRSAGVPPAIIFGALADKDFSEMLSLLLSRAKRLLLVPVKSERAAPVQELNAICRKMKPDAAITPCSSLKDALAKTADSPLIVITGSLYLVGEALERLGLSFSTRLPEAALNEWGPPTR